MANTLSYHIGPSSYPDVVSPTLNWVLWVYNNPQSFFRMIFESGPFFFFQAFLALALVVFFIGFVYVVQKRNEVMREIHKKTALSIARRPEIKSRRWDVVLGHLSSENPAEWRLAVIEADTMLEEVIRRMGYKGDTLGEMLKKMNKSVLVTINEAWEAHKIRNQIAHKGSSFVFSKPEAKRIIGLYEKVFKEMEII